MVAGVLSIGNRTRRHKLNTSTYSYRCGFICKNVHKINESTKQTLGISIFGVIALFSSLLRNSLFLIKFAAWLKVHFDLYWRLIAVSQNIFHLTGINARKAQQQMQMSGRSKSEVRSDSFTYNMVKYS